MAARASEPRTRHLDPDGRPLFTNRLALEQSPYLLQHAHNPVNWYPWGDAAFAAARARGVPVLLSVGYSTCHWCHVMEEESFEDPEIAAYLNRHYVAIKVDREERPDVDAVYMSAVQAATGRGGWPMTVWLNAEREPFFGATYFPPRRRGERPGLLETLERMSGVYSEDPARVARAASGLAKAIAESLAPRPAVGVPDAATLRAGLARYRAGFDPASGGLRGRMKFPGTLPIPILLRADRRGEPGVRAMALTTLDAMRRGGIYDHVGGGFHRYTTEPSWTVPHFEKMLYDNALLAVAYLEAWQVTGEPAYAALVRDVLDYVAREMTAPSGAFYSATDADSEGEEGRYFVWTREQVREAVGADLAPLALDAYGLDRPANFEGRHWVLRRDVDPATLADARGVETGQLGAELEVVRARLREARGRRVPPLTDDKQLVAWNGLMIQAYARAGLALRDAELIERGALAARALLDGARREGSMARYLRGGRAYGVGVLDDYAFLEAGLLDLFEASGDVRWLDAATDLQRELDGHFFDESSGGYWLTRDDGERLLARNKPTRDGARPSGNSVAALNLLRLYTLTGVPAYREHAEMTLRAFSDELERSPQSMGRMLEALDYMLDTPLEIAIVTPRSRAEANPFLDELGRTYLPNRVLVVSTEAAVQGLAPRVPVLELKRALDGRTTAFVCEDRVCDLPARSPEVFARQLRKKARPYARSAP